MSKFLVRALSGAIVPLLMSATAQAGLPDDLLAVRARTAVLTAGVVPEQVNARDGTVSITLPASAAGQAETVRQAVQRIGGAGSVNIGFAAAPVAPPSPVAPLGYAAPSYIPAPVTPAPVAPPRVVAAPVVSAPAPTPAPETYTAPSAQLAYAPVHYSDTPATTSPAPTRTERPLRGLSNGPMGIIDEVRIGAQLHDYFPMFPSKERRNVDLNGEILFDSPNLAPFRWVWNPRPHIGGTYNFSHLTSFAYAGLTWEVSIYKGFFADLALGGAWHSGWLGADAPSYRKRLGSDILFREGIDLGYRFNGTHAVSFYADHLSNAHLAHYNQGLSQVGIRYGYKFNGPTRYE